MNAEVTIQSDGQEKKQWGTQWFYNIEGMKRTLHSTHAIYFSVTVFSIAVIALLVQDSPAPYSSSQSPISQATISDSDQVTVNIPALSENTYQSASRNGTRRKITYLGPKLIERPRLNQIPPGSIAQAILISGASNGSVRAELKEPFTLNGETLIEEGSVLIGSGSSTEERLMIRFNQLVSKDGQVQNIKAQALDQADKIVGLKGSKIGNYAWKTAGSIGLGFVGGLSEGLQETEVQNGVAIKSPSMKNALLKGTSTAALDQSREIISELRNKPPVIEVPSGTIIFILFE